MITRAYNPLKQKWTSMHTRAANTRDDWRYRGVSVCPRWSGRDGLEHFIADMGPSYFPGAHLHRVEDPLGRCGSRRCTRPRRWCGPARPSTGPPTRAETKRTSL